MVDTTFQMVIFMNFEKVFVLFKFLVSGTSQVLQIWEERKEKVGF